MKTQEKDTKILNLTIQNLSDKNIWLWEIKEKYGEEYMNQFLNEQYEATKLKLEKIN